ncbi:MAG: hypothetical protein MJ252_02220 [archaeon]|nr:hypothetical protein [archaeon]
MGACQESNVIEVKKQNKSDSLSQMDLNQLESEMRKEYPDMKEWKGERYTGIGIKKMKGYKCNLPIDKLNQKRNEFWHSKSKLDPVQKKMWRIINQACVYDECKEIFLIFR